MEPRQRILSTAEALGLSMSAEFVPFSQSRNAKPGPGREKPWRSLNWRVGIFRAYQGQPEAMAPRLVLETDYGAGEAHAPGYKASKATLVRSGYSDSVARDLLIAYEVENGKAATFQSYNGGRPSPMPRGEPLQPDFADVLASLVLDASVLDAGGFEDWAAELGYDADSRAAEVTYRACLEIALKLRAAIGDEGLTALREAAQDF